MSPVSTVKGLLWQCPAEPGLLFDSTDYSMSFVPKSEFFLGWAKSRAKQATGKCPSGRTQLIFYESLRTAAQNIPLSFTELLSSGTAWWAVLSLKKNMNFLGKKPSKNTTIFKGLLQTFRASCSHSFSCQLKLNSSLSMNIVFFSLFSHELVLLSRALLQKWAMPLIL